MSAAGSNPAPSASAADFHLARAYAVVALGRVAPLAGVGVLAVVAVSAVTSPGTVASVALGIAWTVAGAGCLLTLVAAVRALRPPVLVRLDDSGVQVRVLRGGGPRAVQWSSVRAVRREPLSPGPCVVVLLNDGRRTVVPERLVAEGGAALAAALSARVDRTHGQRQRGPDAGRGGGGI